MELVNEAGDAVIVGTELMAEVGGELVERLALVVLHLLHAQEAEGSDAHHEEVSGSP